MRGSLVVAGAFLGAVALVGAPAQASAAPDPYSPAVQTDCNVSVPAVVEPGKHVRITVRVEANSPTPPTGEVDLAVAAKGTSQTVSSRAAADVVWRKTVTYNGGTKTVVGPKLAKGEDYVVNARFRPSDSTFAGCRDSDRFAVDTVDDSNPPSDDGPGGLLPDTGGPAMLWLLLGVGLVGGGAATVVYARRRTSPAVA